ncbi:fumarylacetoacetate hydrolase family protein [Paenibacillus antri]|uniref:Fumarylacetoacetate hydrolase family protein n=1 Tax=Paenibacillus antri TaxID=2582848 RepID=A0A5R9G6R6_9BACL|nr:fumarylacetoacetate hydrolase family protein [Paenibacillus antri]TLS52092.1 fumarylacetoacetate hydrolase family protein [Paenibacillus antri]
MKLFTLLVDGEETAAIAAPRGLVLVERVNRELGTGWKTTVFEMLEAGQTSEMAAWHRAEGGERIAALDGIPYGRAAYAPLYRRPRKIWGIGFNYAANEEELRQADPDAEPVGFLKPDTALIGPGDPIRLPAQSERTVAEAELAIVIGKPCKNVPEEEAERYVAGFAAVFDMSADDIHQRNPRFLTRAKSFDTFFSFGSELVTPDEYPDVLDIEVRAALNGETMHRNVLRNMRFRPWQTVAFHSKVMTLLPGDVIMTGTPGAVVIRAGDTVECSIDGLTPLANPIVREP